MTPNNAFTTLMLLVLTAWSGIAQSTIPETPAGQVLRAWLDAFNSGDRSSIETYVKTMDSSQSSDEMISLRNHTGGFELLSVESSEPTHIRFRVKGKGSPVTAFGNLLVKNTQPPAVETFGLRTLPPGVVPANVTLDAELRQRVVQGVNANLAEFYFDPALAGQMQDALLGHQNRREYDSITDGDAFAARLTQDLRAVSHDKHLGVGFSPFKILEPPSQSSAEIAHIHERMKHGNCAFQEVQILPRDIGYLKFNAFMDPGACAPTVVFAMGFLAYTDAVIIDLRDNGGGDPAMVTFVASFLFDKPTHLNDFYNRKEDSTQQFWTLSYVPGPRLAKKPVFVLTSKRTFSGAEEFAYDMQNQKRATIVGETTGGAANPVGGHTVADYFMVGVPFAKAVNPVSETNWEGTGVEPDVKVSAADALATAEKLAAEEIQSETH